MTKHIVAAVLAVLALGTLAVAQEKQPQENPDEVIRYLLDYVAKSDCTFIRNGTDYGGKAAADHLESKYRYYKKEIKTPEDFIVKAATTSGFSGKPYMIRTKDGKELRCDEWLKNVLADYRKAQKDKKEGEAKT